MENWGPYLRSWFDKLTIWCQLIFFSNILCDHCLHDLHLYIQKRLSDREMVNLNKMGLFSILLCSFTINCVTTGARKMPIEYIFCFICSEQCITIISSTKNGSLYSSLFLYSRKLFLITQSLLFKKWVG